MKLSYEGIGQWSATFACEQAKRGEVVKMSGNCAVAPCLDGDAFCGVVLTMARGGDACAVQLGGMVTVGFTGPALALGRTALTADGSGGVKGGGTEKYLVVDVDETAGTVTFAL